MSFPDSRSSQFVLRRSLRLLGMSNPERQFALRRSPRLLGKSSITKPQRSVIKLRKSRKTCKSGNRVSDCMPHLTTYIRNNDIEGFMRRSRKNDANLFRLIYSYGSCDNIMEQKMYISSNGTSSCLDKSFGFMWVAVHGMDSICVVVNMNTTLDAARLRGFIESHKQGSLFRLFAITVICEIEDLADSSIESCQTFDLPIKKPFAVVPMIPSTTDVEESGHEASAAVSNENTAVKILKEKMKSDIAFSETTQIAISALQHVVHQKFNADDIWVSVLLKGVDVRHLQTCDINKHLVVINEPGSGGSGSSGSSGARSAITDESDIM